MALAAHDLSVLFSSLSRKQRSGGGRVTLQKSNHLPLLTSHCWGASRLVCGHCQMVENAGYERRRAKLPEKSS